MATEAQILANRQNALRSTGPRSPDGKAVSRFNALKTGIQAKAQVIPGEDPAELEELAAGYHLQFQPATALERCLVDMLVNADWQLRRLHRIEARLWEHALAGENTNLGQAYESALLAFTRLHRRIDATERSYFRALRQLEQLHPPDPQIPEEWPDAPELASFGHIPSDELRRAEVDHARANTGPPRV